jgi:hypothetical protein
MDAGDVLPPSKLRLESSKKTESCVLFWIAAKPSMDVKLVPYYLSRTVKWWLHNPGCHLDRRLTLDSSYRETLGDLLKGITKDKQVSLSNKIPISEIEII